MWFVVNDGCLHSLLGDSLKDKVAQTRKSNRIYGCCRGCNLFRMSHSQTSCSALRFLEAVPHLLQEGAADQCCPCTADWSGAAAGEEQQCSQRAAGRDLPDSHFTGSLLLTSALPMSPSCRTQPPAEQQQKHEANELQGLLGDVVALCELKYHFKGFPSCQWEHQRENQSLKTPVFRHFSIIGMEGTYQPVSQSTCQERMNSTLPLLRNPSLTCS